MSANKNTKLQKGRLDTNKVRVVEKGPLLWIELDLAVPRYIKFSNGKVGIFDRMAKKARNMYGVLSVPIEQCKEGEFVIHSGAIYRPITAKDSDFYQGLQHEEVAQKFKTDMIEHEIDTDAPVENVILHEQDGQLVEVESIEEIKKKMN